MVDVHVKHFQYIIIKAVQNDFEHLLHELHMRMNKQLHDKKVLKFELSRKVTSISYLLDFIFNWHTVV